MKNIMKSAVVGLSILASAAAFAAPTCPSVSAVKSVRFNAAEFSGDGYVVYNDSFLSLGTSLSWIEAEGLILANSAQKAIQIGQSKLASANGPLLRQAQADDQNGLWVCGYETNDPNVYTIAATSKAAYSSSHAVSLPTPKSAINALKHFAR